MVAEALRNLQVELLPSMVVVCDIPTGDSVAAFSAIPGVIDASPLEAAETQPTQTLLEVALLSIGGSESIHQDSSMMNDRDHRPLLDKNLRLLQFLKPLIPNAQDLALILEHSEDCWRVWSSTFPDILGGRMGRPEQTEVIGFLQHVYQTLASNNILEITKILICLALSIQELPPDFDASQMNLPAPQEILQTYYITSAETFLAPDEGIACTPDGLECMMVQTRFYVNLGKPRKAWTIFRRAITFAQLLGIHRPFNSLHSSSGKKNHLWPQILQGERMLSLILRLPSNTSILDLEVQGLEHVEVPGTEGYLLLKKLFVIAGRIINRDQNQKDADVGPTLEIDRELEEYADMLPSKWWKAWPDPQMPLDHLHDMFMAKFWYHNIRRLLHLPFMLQSLSASGYEYSRIATLNSSRTMIRCFRTLRNSQRPVLIVCNMVDYQAFTAAMTLAINLFQHTEQPRHDLEDQERDWEIIHEFQQDLQKISKERPCSVASQASKLLENIYEARQGRSDRSNDTYEVVIPYFGKVRVGPSQGISPRSSITPTRHPESHRKTQLSTADYPSGLEEANLSFDVFPQLMLGDPISWPDWGLEFTSDVNFDLRDDWRRFSRDNNESAE